MILWNDPHYLFGCCHDYSWRSLMYGVSQRSDNAILSNDTSRVSPGLCAAWESRREHTLRQQWLSRALRDALKCFSSGDYRQEEEKKKGLPWNYAHCFYAPCVNRKKGPITQKYEINKKTEHDCFLCLWLNTKIQIALIHRLVTNMWVYLRLRLNRFYCFRWFSLVINSKYVICSADSSCS